MTYGGLGYPGVYGTYPYAKAYPYSKAYSYGKAYPFGKGFYW